ncbi:hypothetical protein B0H14DRAFT_2582742 [Mycena olivaceomarginata]|nr:hypothetical protein B0H14DRAFT_2582742 [Mycena olivaceomarginata]
MSANGKIKPLSEIPIIDAEFNSSHHLIHHQNRETFIIRNGHGFWVGSGRYGLRVGHFPDPYLAGFWEKKNVWDPEYTWNIRILGSNLMLQGAEAWITPGPGLPATRDGPMNPCIQNPHSIPLNAEVVITTKTIQLFILRCQHMQDPTKDTQYNPVVYHKVAEN